MIDERLRSFVRTGSLHDTELCGRIRRLADRFRSFSRNLPVWGPGEAAGAGLRLQSETYLPFCEVAAALRRLQRVWMVIPSGYLPPLPDTWVDFAPAGACPTANPAVLLERLLRDAEYRLRFFFSLHLPERFGGG
ncbi:MAG TPA: hypothetical protein VNX25_00155, partial [Verrucomicrobiae bacterium]|nr:hypothetical protein [Verrucomicrobiae bacterium]